MAWNQTDSNGHDRDPWKTSKNISNCSEKANIIDKIAALVNDIFHKISRKLNNFSNKKKVAKAIVPNKSNSYVSLLLVIMLVIWASSGLYTIKEAERGVVLRFGKFNRLVYPGLNWKPTFIDTVTMVNVESVRELAASGVMLTSDENLVRVEMNVQYRITDPKRYLFSVTNADDSLQQATDSALRGIIGKYTMDRVLTEGRTVVRSDTQKVLEETIQPYDMGIVLLDVNFQAARPPEEVKAAFDDAIAARENEQQYIREAEAYSNEVKPRAKGKAQRILEEGRAYRTRTVMEAEGEVERFMKFLPEYKAAPEITRKRLYIDSMERILSKTKKIIISPKNNSNLILLPIDQIKNKSSSNNNDSPVCNSDNSNIQNNNHNFTQQPTAANNSNKLKAPYTDDNIRRLSIDRLRINSHRNDIKREG